jgi:dTDP-4-amino-4,6-dideoxygalactose transaminase
MSLIRPIHHTFGPHVDAAYLRRTLALSYAPWAYRKGPERTLLKHDLKDRYGYDAALFSSGREALLALLRAFDLPAGSEVVVQGFTCVVVPNAIKAAGLRAAYADIDPDTLNLTPESVAAVASPRTRVVICQHTFGIPSPAHELRALCDANGWILVEDCAHVLPDKGGPDGILRHADHAVCSFGRDKAVSGVAGGAALTRNPVTSAALADIEAKAKEASFWSVVRLLEYPPRMAHVVRPLTGSRLAGPLLGVLKLLGLFVPVLTEREKKGIMPYAVRRMPNACAALARWQLAGLERINGRRRTLAKRYLEASGTLGWPVMRGIQPSLPLQKYPMFVRNAAVIRAALKAKNIHLDDGWTGCVICPGACDSSAAGYKPGSDPAAEAAARGVLSLPTHPTMTDAQADELVAALAPLLRP